MMNTLLPQFLSALCAGIAMDCLLFQSDSGLSRIPVSTELQVTEKNQIGLSAYIGEAIAGVRSGVSLREAFSIDVEPSWAGAKQAEHTIQRRLATQALPEETEEQINHCAAALAVAYCLSEQLGCEASSCLQAVAISTARLRKVTDLRNNAFAMPQATVKLLSVLPLLTLAAAQLLGANPLGFLMWTPQGWGCIVFGGFCYVSGIVWMSSMLKAVAIKKPVNADMLSETQTLLGGE